MGKLAISLGSLPVLAVEIGTEVLRVGRSAGNDLVLPLPDVGDVHAEISVTGEICAVAAVQGESLHRGGRAVTRADLLPGDEIGLGAYRLRWLGSPSDLLETEPGSGGARTHDTKSLEQPVRRGGRAVGLEVVNGGERGLKLDLDGVIVVGRDPECDLVLNDAAVSWRHCSLEPRQEGVRVRDLDSHNGTFLDGSRIESAAAEAGSRIQVGHTTLRLAGLHDDDDLAAPYGLAELVGRSTAMRDVYSRIREAAASRMPVLLLGETGTGKELAARAVHSIGPRSHRPFVPVNCAAIPRDLLEDELFGHSRGAFTGAAGDRVGAFERADEGTVFLDEIGELAPALQVKLLRVLEDGQVPRLGGDTVQCDVRVVVATNSDLATAMAEGRFRNDLYYRVAVLPIRMPPLRDRLDDLPALVRHFLGSAEEQAGIAGGSAIDFDDEALDRLAQHAWPGNVRELRNLVLRCAVETKRGCVDRTIVDRILAESVVPEGAVAPSGGQLREIERETIRRALEDCGGQRRAAARRLGIAESTLYDKIQRYGLADVGR